MLDEPKKKMSITLLGSGCASLSLAARSQEFDAHQFIVVDPKNRLEDDHTWGFWALPRLSHVATKSRKSWNNWRVIGADQMVELSSQQHPYCAIGRHTWLKH